MRPAERYEQVRARVAAAAAMGAIAHGPREVTLIAVSKTQPATEVQRFYELGQRDFGENYVQELVDKARMLEERGIHDIRWHFIGHLQSNKARLLVELGVRCVHAVDSLKLAGELAKRWAESKGAGRTDRLPVMIEVNIDSEPSKAGVPPSQARALAEGVAELGKQLELRGLMCIPEPRTEGRPPERAFARLRELEAHCRPFTSGALSMGMSSDFEAALREGATHVRVGSALFGSRA